MIEVFGFIVAAFLIFIFLFPLIVAATGAGLVILGFVLRIYASIVTIGNTK